jgi:hypothetical protein
MAIGDSSPLNAYTRWALLLLGLIFGALALAQNIVMTGAAIVTQVNGSVEVRIGNNPPVPLLAGSQLPAGAIVSTGTKSNGVLTFADGQVIVLGERTLFRIVNYDFDPKALASSGVFLNLIEGSARLVMGTIGEFDPKLIRIQVGTGTLVGAANPEGGGPTDASVVVQGAATIVTVTHGSVVLTLPTGEGITVSSGQGAFVQASGAVQQGAMNQIANQVGQTPDGKQVLEQLDSLLAYVFPQNQTIITLATPAAPALPDEPTSSIDPPVTGPTTTAPTGAGGGGTPCAASCN